MIKLTAPVYATQSTQNIFITCIQFLAYAIFTFSILQLLLSPQNILDPFIIYDDIPIPCRKQLNEDLNSKKIRKQEEN